MTGCGCYEYGCYEYGCYEYGCYGYGCYGYGCYGYGCYFLLVQAAYGNTPEGYGGYGVLRGVTGVEINYIER